MSAFAYGNQSLLVENVNNAIIMKTYLLRRPTTAATTHINTCIYHNWHSSYHKLDVCVRVVVKTSSDIQNNSRYFISFATARKNLLII